MDNCITLICEENGYFMELGFHAIKQNFAVNSREVPVRGTATKCTHPSKQYMSTRARAELANTSGQP